MLGPEIGQAGFRLAMFLIVTAAVLLPFQAAGSAEQVITVATLALGLILAAVVFALVRWRGP